MTSNKIPSFFQLKDLDSFEISSLHLKYTKKELEGIYLSLHNLDKVNSEFFLKYLESSSDLIDKNRIISMWKIQSKILVCKESIIKALHNKNIIENKEVINSIGETSIESISKLKNKTNELESNNLFLEPISFEPPPPFKAD